jgi:glycosyltransferase involved in cell wall biosynthesis
MPRVSIVLPTFNRADTILRAVESVRAQTFQDWELIVVDDGSTDGTAKLLEGLDPRVRIFSQENQGMGGARNRGLRECAGDYIAFQDSDDEWLPHHLELFLAFFEAHPAEHLLSGEFWFDNGGGDIVKHFRVWMSDWYPDLARRIGSTSLALPPDESDGYLRFYERREEIGEWGRAIVARTPFTGVRHYSGNLGEKWRWGWLMATQATMFSRAAFERFGLFDTSYPIASDFGYLAKLCRAYRANMLSIPSCIKHEYSAAGGKLKQDHLVTGKSALQFARDMLRWHDELYWNERPHDPELSALRGYCQLYAGRVALSRGLATEALGYLEEARRTVQVAEIDFLCLLPKMFPHPALLSAAYSTFGKWQSLRDRASSKLKQLRGAATPIEGARLRERI